MMALRDFFGLMGEDCRLIGENEDGKKPKGEAKNRILLTGIHGYVK